MLTLFKYSMLNDKNTARKNKKMCVFKIHFYVNVARFNGINLEKRQFQIHLFKYIIQNKQKKGENLIKIFFLNDVNTD